MENTLGYHREMSAATFGPDSPATKFLDEKIAAAPNGPDEELLSLPGQLIEMLVYLHAGGRIH